MPENRETTTPDIIECECHCGCEDTVEGFSENPFELSTLVYSFGNGGRAPSWDEDYSDLCGDCHDGCHYDCYICCEKVQGDIPTNRAAGAHCFDLDNNRWREYPVCGACQFLYFSNCDSCEIYAECTDSLDHPNVSLCRECQQDPTNTTIGVQPYSTKPTYTPKGETGSRIYGIEIEAQIIENNVQGEFDQGDSESTRNYMADRVRDLLPEDYAVIKEDCSLEPDDRLIQGFEICTRPASMAVHRDSLIRLTEEKPKGLVSWDTWSKRYPEGNCGVHIHADRKMFDGRGYGEYGKNGDVGIQIVKQIAFVYSPDNFKFIKAIAGRCATRWADFSKDKKITEFFGAKGINSYDISRYEAINTTNDRTIEYRLFKGSLIKETLWRYMEFVDALITYTSSCNYGLPQMESVATFVGYVQRNRKQYPTLVKFCKEWMAKERLFLATPPSKRGTKELKIYEYSNGEELALKRLAANPSRNHCRHDKNRVFLKLDALNYELNKSQKRLQKLGENFLPKIHFEENYGNESMEYQN